MSALRLQVAAGQFPLQRVVEIAIGGQPGGGGAFGRRGVHGRHRLRLPVGVPAERDEVGQRVHLVPGQPAGRPVEHGREADLGQFVGVPQQLRFQHGQRFVAPEAHVVADGRGHGRDLARREVGRGQEASGEGGPGDRVAVAVGVLAHVVEPGGGLDDLRVGAGQLGQPPGEGDDGRDVLPAVVERHVGGAVAGDKFALRGLVHGGAGGFAPRGEGGDGHGRIINYELQIAGGRPDSGAVGQEERFVRELWGAEIWKMVKNTTQTRRYLN